MGLLDKFVKKNPNNVVKIDINEENGCVYSPVNGKVLSLESLDDGMFSEKILGDGIVVVPSDGNFIVPVSGTVVTAFPTGHAYGIKTDSGIEVLVHIGLDTVSLKGEGFTSCVKQGQKVKVGDKLASVDLDVIKKAGFPTETMLVVTSKQEITQRHGFGSEAKCGEKLLEIK